MESSKAKSSFEESHKALSNVFNLYSLLLIEQTNFIF